VIKVKILLFQDQLVLKEKQVQLELQEWQAQRVLQDHKVLLVMMVMMVLMGKMEKMVFLPMKFGLMPEIRAVRQIF
tara:strand:- start:68 stop:295 length:228 start_codon:yes stop_codon:yes gene_type:complete